VGAHLINHLKELQDKYEIFEEMVKEKIVGRYFVQQISHGDEINLDLGPEKTNIACRFTQKSASHQEYCPR
jgi:hypothetical protein